MIDHPERFKHIKFMLSKVNLSKLEKMCESTGLTQGELAKAALLQQLRIIDPQSFWNKVPVQQREILRSH